VLITKLNNSITVFSGGGALHTYGQLSQLRVLVSGS